MVFLGVLSAVLVLLIAYVLTMCAYFSARKKNTGAKYLIEVVTVLIAFGLSFLTRFTILLINDHQCFSDGFLAVLNAIYSSIGGLAFDGGDMGVAGMHAINCLYSGASLYAGAIFLSVVTAKASYDVYSGIRIYMLRLSRARKKGLVDLFIFSSVTEDALLLARSIGERYQNQSADKKNKKRHVIIFSGEGLETFDRKNPMHSEIMSQGYFYWPFAVSENERPKSLLKRLGLNVDNDFTQNKKPLEKTGEVHIFAFTNNTALSGLESENSSLVANEVKTLTGEYVKCAPQKRSIVNFYILSDGAIDYGYYNTFIKDAVNSEIEGLEVKPDEDLTQKLCNFYFQLKVINEADLTGKCLAERRSERFVEDSNNSDENLFLKDVKASAEQPFRALVMGFGRTGQCALAELVNATAYVDKNGNAGQFYADVYDTNASSIAGIYTVSHPLCHCVSLGDKVHSVEQSDLTDLAIESTQNIFGSANCDLNEVTKTMCLPIIGFHSLSCYSYEFINYLDLKVGDEKHGEQYNKSRYNAFIASLGNDEDNIKIANAIISDLKRESKFAFKPDFLQTVYVNVRNPRNLGRVLWTSEDKARYPQIKVVLFGESTDLYSYARIIDDNVDATYNYVYNRLFDQISSEKSGEITPLEQIKQALIKADSTDYSSAINKLLGGAGAFDKQSALSEWLSLDLWRKQSNGGAKRFSANYQTFIKDNPLTGENISLLAHIEHERWCRFYIMHGWAYKNYQKADKAYYQANKYHNCICPMSMIDVGVQLYDVGNVLIAKSKAIS